MIAPLRKMDNRRLNDLIVQATEVIEGQPGFWHVRYGQREIWIITDETHDRMRVMTPIMEEANLTQEDFRILLLANFDRALDAKYAISQGALWSIFVHPLEDLSGDLFLNAIHQVHTLADNYGTTYTSTDLAFHSGDD
ncbi:MAG: hypothetical protein ACI9G1_001345 [Pirellulaceae bacterium]|jgi:hypothetical protein